MGLQRSSLTIYLSTKYTIFKVNLSLGVTKPLIPSYVAREISQLETEAMRESIV